MGEGVVNSAEEGRPPRGQMALLCYEMESREVEGMSDLIAVLTGARARVERGWIQDQGRTRDGMCAGHAIADAWREVTGQSLFEYALQHALSVETCKPPPDRYQLFDDATDTMLQAANEMTLETWPDIPQWNDCEGRTLEQVLETFDRALKLAGKEG